MRFLLPLLAACTGRNVPVVVATPEPAPSWTDPAAVVRSALDPSVDPCTDFYAYSCGTWIRNHPLPADETMVFRSFTTIEDHNDTFLRSVLENAAARPDDTDPARRALGAFWTACMDAPAIDARGLAPVAAVLDQIAALDDKRALMVLVGELQASGWNVLFGVDIEADPKNPGLAILELFQAGTSLPDRESYLTDEAAPIRRAFQEHVARLFVLAGRSGADAAQASADVLAFETRLAALQWEPGRLRDATATYNKLDRRGIEKLTPGIDWAAFLRSRGRPELTQINVLTPSFFEGMADVVATTDLPTLRTYLAWRVLDGSADDLGQPFVDASFAFYGRTLSGQQQPEPRWKRCVAKADTALGDLLAQAYVAEAFPGESQDVATDMIARIEAAFEAALPEIGWMDPDTRARAIEKARAITNKIGHPRRWRDVGFEVRPDDHFGNVRRAAEADAAYWLDKAEKPIDPDSWRIPAQTVNAFYDPTQNEIVFPAGVLQPPIFSVGWPKAMNYGAMGMGMGHEITHGFDDEGRKYDAEGRLTEWWAPTASARFEEAAACVETQYGGFEVEPGLPVDGGLTLGENLADLGGVRLAWRAYRQWVAEHGEEPAVAGLTGDQLFFVSVGQAWCAAASPEMARLRAVNDPHAPPRFRVNGPLRNLPEFADTFGCEVGEPMRPAETCTVW